MSIFDLIILISEKYSIIGRAILDFVHPFFQVTFNVFLILAIIASFFFYFVIVYVFLTRNRKQKLYEFIESSAPFVTIQLPTMNELSVINCAKYCINFDYPKEKFEILIGDDSNQPEVSKNLRDFAALHDNVFVHQRDNNSEFKAGNLKNLLPHSRGEILVLFDSDFLPKKDFLKRIIAPFQHEDYSVVQARWNIINPNTNLVTILAAAIMKSFHYITMPFLKRFSKSGLLCGSAEAVRKKDIVEVGGWSGHCLIEDIEASMRLHTHKKRFLYLEDLQCDCEVPFTLKDFAKQQHRWAYGVTKSITNHLKDYLNSKPKFRLSVGLLLFSSGYVLTSLFIGLFIFGVLAFVTHEPSPINIPLFVKETLRNVLLTSALVVGTIYAIFQDKDIRRVDKLVFATFTIGIYVMVWVMKGLYQMVMKKEIAWFIPKKIKS